MRIVVTGATGNVGTSVLSALVRDPGVTQIVGVARRRPSIAFDRVDFRTADVGVDDLEPILRGADAVVHLAWQMQPSHDGPLLTRTNVVGSERVFDAAVRAGAKVIVHASSIGTYATGPKEQPVDESHPSTGIASSVYSQQKAAVERILEQIEEREPSMRVVRMRPALVFKREAASDLRRIFIGPFVPRLAFDHRVLRVVPDHPRFALQCVHGSDVGDAFRAAVMRDVRGAFNLAADPILDGPTLARVLGAVRVKVPFALVRAAVAATWAVRLQPTDPGWVDLTLGVPSIDSSRARRELGWSPRYRADEALLEVLAGLRAGDGADTPPLAPRRWLGHAKPSDPTTIPARLLAALRPSRAT